MKYLFFALALLATAVAQPYRDVANAIEKKEYDRALQLAQAQAVDPKDAYGQYYLGYTHYLKATELKALNATKANELLEKARAIHQGAVERKAKDVLNYVGLAYYHMGMGKYNDAMNQLTTVRNIETDDILILTEAARANITFAGTDGVDDRMKAIAQTNANYFVSRAEAKAPENVSVLMAAGYVYYVQQVWQLAESKYRKVVTLDNSKVEAHFNLGRSLFELKKYQEAETEYKKVLELDKEYAQAYRQLAEFYYLWGRSTPSDEKNKADKETRYNTAKTYAQEFRKRVPGDIYARVRYAELQYYTGAYAEAETEFAAVLAEPELSGSNAIKRLLAYCKVENNKCQEGLDILTKQVPETELVAIDFKYMGQAYYCLGQDDKSVEYIKKAAAKDPKVATFYSEQYQKKKDAKEYDEAYKLLKLHLKTTDKPAAVDLYWATWLANRAKDNENTVAYGDLALAALGDKQPDLYLYQARAYARMAEEEGKKTAKPEDPNPKRAEMADKMAAKYEKYLEVQATKTEAERSKFAKDMSEAYWALAFHYYDDRNPQRNLARSFKYTNLYLGSGDERYKAPAEQVKTYLEGQKITPEN